MRLEELERELRAESPELESEFARRLDEWAAAGFPQGGELDPRHRAADGDSPRTAGRNGLAPLREPFARTLDRLRSAPLRRVLAPAGAAATLVVVVAVALTQSGDEVTPSSGGGELTLDTDEAREESQVPSTAAKGAARRAAGDELVTPAPIPPPGDGGGIARGTDQRIIDATAQLTLGADADEVQSVANDVVEVTDRHDGIVSRSQVTSDEAGARATFELEIPFKRLDAALTDLSELGDVISRTEGGEDITARAVRARRALAETLGDIQQARVQLIRTDDPEQRRIIRSRIRFLDATADQHRAQLAGVKRQGRFATVAVEVTSSKTGSSDGGWSLDEAADDALDVLTTVGGILLISLAVLVPLAVLAALAWLALARARRASRERALDA